MKSKVNRTSRLMSSYSKFWTRNNMNWKDSSTPWCASVTVPALPAALLPARPSASSAYADHCLLSISRGAREARSQDIGYLSFSPSEKSDKFTTSLAWLRHAVWGNQTGMGQGLLSLCLNSSLVDPGCKPQPSQWSSKFVTFSRGREGQVPNVLSRWWRLIPKPKLLTETRSWSDPIWAFCGTFDDHIYPWFGFTVATQSYNCNEWLPSHFCTSGLQILLQTIIHFYGHMSFHFTSECDTLIYFLYFMLNWSAFTRHGNNDRKIAAWIVK